MRGKNISFTEVLKHKAKKNQQAPLIKSHCRLADMFVQFEINPNDQYTLSYGQSLNQRNSQYMTASSKQRKGGQFDSFIQGFGERQLDSSHNHNSYSRSQYLSSREQQASNPLQEIPKKGNQGLQQVDMICSKKYGDESINESSSRRYDQNSPESQNNQFAANKPISDRLPTTTKTFKNMRRSHKTPAVKQKQAGQLQQIINSTDHIHEEIADLAHKYVLQKKKQSQKEDELLISLEDQEKLLAVKKKSSSGKKRRQESHQNQQRMKDEAKKQINIFLKKNQIQSFVPTFGAMAKKSSKEWPEEKNKYMEDQSIQLEFNEVIKNEVGYSFATAHQAEPPSEHVPALNLNDQAPTIPLIQQIASQRQYSQGNEQIENMYSKWHKEEPINISHENIQNIESMCYLAAMEQKMPGFHSGGKRQSGKEEKQDKETINFNFRKDENNPSSISNRDVGIEQPDPQGQSYADALCLSKTEKKFEQSFKSSSDICQLSSPSSESTVKPQRDIYLSNEHPQFPESLAEQQKVVETSQFDLPKSGHPQQIIESAKYEIKQENVPIKQKQSPKQYLHSYGLNKVYSNGKTIENSKAEPVHTSDFNQGKQNKPSGGKLAVINSSNKSKEKVGCRIQSYAHTSMFTACQKPESPKVEHEEFTFDL